MHYKYLKMHIYSFTWMLVDVGTKCSDANHVNWTDIGQLISMHDYMSLSNYKRNQNVTFFALNLAKEQINLIFHWALTGRAVLRFSIRKLQAKKMHQQKAFLTIWNTLILFPVLSEIEINPKLTIWRKPLSVYALVTCRVGCTKPFNHPWSFHCLCFKFQCERVHACGIRTCLCGTAVWPASDSFSIL